MMTMSTHGPNLGRASAAKRGRNSRWPYVPIIDYGPQAVGVHTQRTEQIRKRAFATRDEAVAYAQRVIDRRLALHETNLVTPRNRASREQYGFPRELTGVQVTYRSSDAHEHHPLGVVVQATVQERDQGSAELGVSLYDMRDYVLVEWPDGRRWHRPEDIRIARREV